MGDSTPSALLPARRTEHAVGPHQAAQDWSYRVPSPPRIVVPPLMYNDDGEISISLKPQASSADGDAEVPTLDFLEPIFNEDFVGEIRAAEWRYEWRREAQMILPFLYLGPMAAARDRDFLRREGITMLLAVRDTMSAQARLLDGTRVSRELGIECRCVDVAGNAELIAAFPQAIHSMNVHLAQRYLRHVRDPAGAGLSAAPATGPGMGKVLVYCESGNERSAGVVAAYLMTMYEMSVVQVIQLVQMQRFCASFDDSMKQLLLSYGQILAAKRDVMRASAGVGAPGPARTNRAREVCNVQVLRIAKRTLDEALDADMEDDEPTVRQDEGPSEHRGSAPFRDSVVLAGR